MTSGLVVWITGLPSAGKLTLGARVLDALRDRVIPTCLLDGDAVRKILVPDAGYSATERSTFYERLANLAALLARQGLIVLVPATAHRRAFRDRARALAPDFVEVWLDTPLEECLRRDAKGLYAKARAGEARGLPGGDEGYEPPLRAELVLQGESTRLEAASARVLRLVEARARYVPDADFLQ